MGRPAGAEPPHGTRYRYQWRADPCRCSECTGANTRYQARYRLAGTGRMATLTR